MLKSRITHFNSLPEGLDAKLLGEVAFESKNGLLHIALDDRRMATLKACISFFHPTLKIIEVPAWDCLPYDRVSPNQHISSLRVEALCEIAISAREEKANNSYIPHTLSHTPHIILTSVNSIMQRVPPRKVLEEISFLGKAGEKVSRDGLINYLIKCGYIRSATANDSGEFAVRGSIIDIMPSGCALGLRLDFFGDILENIRQFDPLSQVSSGKLGIIKLTPASELIFDDEKIELFRTRYRELFGATTDDPLYEAICDGRHYAGMEHWLPLFYPKMETLFDYLPEATISFDHLAIESHNERLEVIKDYYGARKDASIQKIAGSSYKPIPPEMLYLMGDELEIQTSGRVRVYTSPWPSPASLAKGAGEAFIKFTDTSPTNKDGEVFINLNASKAPDFSLVPSGSNSLSLKRAETIGQRNDNYTAHGPGDETSLDTKSHNPFEVLKEYCHKNIGTKILLACYSEGSQERIKHMLSEHDLVATICTNYADAISTSKGVISLVILELEHGFEHSTSALMGESWDGGDKKNFINPDNTYLKSKDTPTLTAPPQSLGNITLFTEQDILGMRISTRRTSKRSASRILSEAASLSEGQLVVHKQHGLGRFEKLEAINVSGDNHDCLLIIYDGGDKLYVPVENIDSISRYGSEDEGVKLDRLGSGAWQERKSRMKKRIKMMAEELLKIAAARLLKKAPALLPAEGLYEEFCARFPYAETDDQLRSISEVEADLSSGRPMDRLICGDVGFGKTEVALRAAFIAASDGRQVAVITPTTLLCRQHIKTFKSRFHGFPFEVRGLSRLTHSGEARRTRNELADGKVDIVIGTHALLARSINFKNLGLVIVDEEQLFGVKQKERLKQLKADVHMLTLSATPIPRTLQMSLTGIKELSMIATPPVDRLAIRSFTMPYDPVVLRNAILREHYRGGQVFYVVPRISDLDEISIKIKELVPEIKIARAHGQMLPDDLDNVMNDFYDGKFDMLISTNIIGSGIDLPTANTIIVHRADMFGLAQLYQMRGRVGRGKLRAYAYFTTPPRKVPNPLAMKRLEVIQNLDSLGAGFTLASFDMDIRGFGNMLGEEQSGQIKEVGVELYQEMLREAVANAKSSHKDEEAEDKLSPQINLGIPVLIPGEYISDIELRLGMYRRLAGAENNDELESLAAEMIDRFGKPPTEVSNLFEIMKVKQQCLQAGINKIDAGPKGIVVSFHNNTFKNPEALINFIARNPLKTKLRSDMKLVFMSEFDNPLERVRRVRESLDKIIALAA
jgi:transcription-repair coupling factor (superfamily II helicase)